MNRHFVRSLPINVTKSYPFPSQTKHHQQVTSEFGDLSYFPPENDSFFEYTDAINSVQSDQSNLSIFPTGSVTEANIAESLKVCTSRAVPQQYGLEEPSSTNQDTLFNCPATNHTTYQQQFDTNTQLRSVIEIPERYRGVFAAFSHFNIVQTKVFDDVLYSDAPLVTSAPTGSGKTVIFELAIVRLLIQMGTDLSKMKIIYVAPIKALCAERYEDWSAKFGPIGLQCAELTGDSQLDDYFDIQNAQIIMTTPEKWDSMTRKWRDNKSLVQMIQLFLIDEIHQLNDITRGPTMEAIVCRMKTIRASVIPSYDSRHFKNPLLRFIAVSATVPNIEDVVIWLGSSEDSPAIIHCIDDSHRPVQLRKVVLAYPDATTDFKFDLSLNYKLSSVIQCYAEFKPTLVFCATRKGTQQAAGILVKDAKFIMNIDHKRRLQSIAAAINDNKLKELVLSGVGFHHAGLSINDRKNIESTFYNGDLPVLFATSTLAMGVNLPAHLVVIKSTLHYVNGSFEEYTESQILQMIGRAGRPQFDISATAVIMTRISTKSKYEALLGGTQLVESNLHSHLIEHLNAEVVLHTITDVSIALDWLKSTFLFTRIKKNPKYYGIPENLSNEELQEKLQAMCLENLKELESVGLLNMDDGFTLVPTDTGRLMARYYVAFESMKRFLKLKDCGAVSELIDELSQCKEFEDVRLRVSEKRILNQLNKDKHRQTIRYPMAGRIKSTNMKVNCLIQAMLGCLSIQEFSLNQESQKIFRSASRLSKCLMEVQMLNSSYKALLGSIVLHKCIAAKLWENSKHVAKQLDKIGVALGTTLVNAGMTSFDKIIETNARELELIVNRHPPFGNQIKEAAKKIPRYKLDIEQSSIVRVNEAELTVIVSLLNWEFLNESRSVGSLNNGCVLVIGDDDDNIVLKQRVNDSQLYTTGKWSKQVTVSRAIKGIELKANLISLQIVGIDVQMTYFPQYIGYFKQHVTTNNMKKEDPNPLSTNTINNTNHGVTSAKNRQPCAHRCLNKAVCGHDCCKFGLQNKQQDELVQKFTKVAPNSDPMCGYHSKLQQKIKTTPTPIAIPQQLNSLKVNTNNSDYFKYIKSSNGTNINKFEYNPKQPMKYSYWTNNISTSQVQEEDCYEQEMLNDMHFDAQLEEHNDIVELDDKRESLVSSPLLVPSPPAYNDEIYLPSDFDNSFEDTVTLSSCDVTSYSGGMKSNCSSPCSKRQCLRRDNDISENKQPNNDGHFARTSSSQVFDQMQNVCTRNFEKVESVLQISPAVFKPSKCYSTNDTIKTKQTSGGGPSFFINPVNQCSNKEAAVSSQKVEDHDFFESVFAGIF